MSFEKNHTVNHLINQSINQSILSQVGVGNAVTYSRRIRRFGGVNKLVFCAVCAPQSTNTAFESANKPSSSAAPPDSPRNLSGLHCFWSSMSVFCLCRQLCSGTDDRKTPRTRSWWQDWQSFPKYIGTSAPQKWLRPQANELAFSGNINPRFYFSAGNLSARSSSLVFRRQTKVWDSFLPEYIRFYSNNRMELRTPGNIRHVRGNEEKMGILQYANEIIDV